jgi:hypothetical protein
MHDMEIERAFRKLMAKTLDTRDKNKELAKEVVK